MSGISKLLKAFMARAEASHDLSSRVLRLFERDNKVAPGSLELRHIQETGATAVVSKSLPADELGPNLGVVGSPAWNDGVARVHVERLCESLGVKNVPPTVPLPHEESPYPRVRGHLKPS